MKKQKINKIVSPFYFNLNKIDKKLFYKNLNNILNSGTFILGRYNKEFENEFAKKFGTKFAVAVNSGTSALEILINYFTRQKKTLVAVPTNTNFATVASIIRSNGYPVYLDMDEKYLSPSLEQVKKKHKYTKFKGLVYVHIAGIISPDFDKIAKFCKKKKIFLIEDCAHAHGSKLKKKFAGTFGSGGAFSFYPTKVMTTMEGGIIITNSIDIKKFAISMRNQGKGLVNFGCYHIDFGNSWRMLEVSALLGLIQLKKLNKMIKKRSLVAKIYEDKLKGKAIKFSRTNHMDQASNYKFVIYAKNKKHCEFVKNKLKKQNIICGGGVYELPCHKQPVFKKYNKFSDDLRISENFCKRQICLPIHHNLNKKEATNCITKLLDAYQEKI